MALCKLEGKIIITSTTVVGTFAGASVSVNANSYYLIDFVSHLKTQLDAATARTWTLTIDDNSDTSTGKLTMSVTGGATTGTWTSGTIEALLGFTSNLGSGTSWTGANQCKYLFLPNCNRSEVMAPQSSSGAIDADATHVMAPSGASYNIGYTVRYVDTLRFMTLQGSKAWAALETTTNESLETFYTDVIAVGRGVRFYADRSSDGTYRNFVVRNPGTYMPRPLVPSWTDSAKSLWSIAYDVAKEV